MINGFLSVNIGYLDSESTICVVPKSHLWNHRFKIRGPLLRSGLISHFGVVRDKMGLD